MVFTGPDGPNPDTYEIIRGAADLPRRILLGIHGTDAGSVDTPEGAIARNSASISCMKNIIFEVWGMVHMRGILIAIPVILAVIIVSVYGFVAFEDPQKEPVNNVINASSSIEMDDDLKTEITNATDSDGPKHYVIDASDSPSMGGN